MIITRNKLSWEFTMSWGSKKNNSRHVSYQHGNLDWHKQNGSQVITS